ncbi:methyltransferase domain-containing protein [Pedobacter frigiditerrae]|uniref:tRNA1(Val) (adenine(37)-N6)-methyltransferase n=1 Tax=Pedobacter frigiditerrae TaxID=2530452 RepID=A0A4R0MR57_9SPHI|nr:methyltransferase [Pedobacter frigiditerrae]TCC89067.1 methyltransferase domain-containing protein [Pedobacter frigiditerrae]
MTKANYKSDKSIFKFKQFEVDQTGCAMKINTDGVLLAAIAESNLPNHILDIGTGTGVIALMLAQRFPDAFIEAVEIDEQASATAERNFQSSVFSNRLTINNTAIEQYIPKGCLGHNTDKFDLIISNPPYFVNDLKNAEQKKGLARHTDEVFFNELIVKVSSLLTEQGNFWFILPVKQAKQLIAKAEGLGLHLSVQINLHSDISRPEFRWIVCLSKRQTKPQFKNFHIYESEKVYTNAYKDLLKDFFLGY